MKYVLSLLAGIAIGVAVFMVGLYHNPFRGQPAVSPLAVTDQRIIELSFSGVPGDALLYTDHGESWVEPHPDRVAELWEPAVAETRLTVTMLEDARGKVAGLGIKFSTASEATNVINGEALADSIWHVYLPGQGTFMIDQTENYWTYIRDVVVPARWSSGDNWRGSFHGILTSGPGSLGTARVSGGSGLFANLSSEAVESVTAKAYSAVTGPVSMTRSLAIALPQPTMASE
jgi:hypothetical protein